MSFTISERYDCIIIEFNDNLVGGPDTVSLNEKLHELLDEGKKKVVVDLSRVQVMNSSGLGMLIGALTTMRNGGGELKLANPSEKVQKLMSLTKLASVFESYESTEEAVSSFETKT